MFIYTSSDYWDVFFILFLNYKLLGCIDSLSSSHKNCFSNPLGVFVSSLQNLFLGITFPGI